MSIDSDEPSYPPPVHLLTDLRADSRYEGDVGEMRAPLVDGVRDRSGAMRFGILATLQDVSGAIVALPATQPDWIATHDLSITLLQPVRGDGVLVRCECLRVGSKSVIVECEIFSLSGDVADAVPSAVGLIAYSRIPGSASVAKPTYSDSSAWAPLGGVESHDLGRVDERLGLERSATATVIEASAYVRNSFGTVNGGVQCALASAEAERAAGGDALTTDLQMHYLTQVGAGPLRATGRVLRAGSGGAVVNVRLFDEGVSPARLVAIATVHC